MDEDVDVVWKFVKEYSNERLTSLWTSKIELLSVSFLENYLYYYVMANNSMYSSTI